MRIKKAGILIIAAAITCTTPAVPAMAADTSESVQEIISDNEIDSLVSDPDKVVDIIMYVKNEAAKQDISDDQIRSLIQTAESTAGVSLSEEEENRIIKIVKQIKDSDIDEEQLRSAVTKAYDKLEEMGIAHYQVEFDTKSPVSTQNIQAYKQLKLILKTNKYDLIHCHTPIVGILTRMAARKYRKAGTTVIYTTHGFAFTDKSSKKSWIVYFTAEKLMSRFCDAIITINHEDYGNAKKMHCPKVYVIPSVGLDNHRFANLRINRDEYRASFGVNSKDHMVLAVGELSSRKNQKIIIEALGTLDRKEQYVFVICGTAVVNSTIEEELKRKASKLGVRIFLAGHRLDIPEINACADVAVIPSVREGFGMTGVEALASGVPVVGSDVQGIREYVIPGKTGYLCDPYDAHQFAEAIENIVNLTPEARNQMAAACKKKAEEFDVSKSIAAMKNIYQEVLSNDRKYEE